MTHSALFSFMTGSERSRQSWTLRTALAARSLVGIPGRLAAAVKDAVARDRSRAQIAALDDRLSRDVGLSPFDTFYGWRGSDAREGAMIARTLDRLHIFTFAR